MFKQLKKSLGLSHEPPTLPLEDQVQPGTPVSSGAVSAGVIDVTDADFDAIVERDEARARLTVVDFWADWCEPCQTMSAYVDFLAADFGDKLLLTAMDVDENPQTPPRFSIMGLPTLLFLRNGQEVGRQVGIIPYEELKRTVEKFIRDA